MQNPKNAKIVLQYLRITLTNEEQAFHKHITYSYTLAYHDLIRLCYKVSMNHILTLAESQRLTS